MPKLPDTGYMREGQLNNIALYEQTIFIWHTIIIHNSDKKPTKIKYIFQDSSFCF